MKRIPSRRARPRGSVMARMSFAPLVVAFLVGCSTKYVIPQRNTCGYDYRLEVAGTKGSEQAGLKIACWRRPVITGDSTVEYRRRLSTAGWVGTIATGVALSSSGAVGWSRGWVALGQYSIGLGVLLPVAAALLAPKHGEVKAPRSLLTFKPAVGEEIVVQNLTRSASRTYTTGADGVAAVPLTDIQDWFSGQEEIGIWIAPLAANDERTAAKVTATGIIAQVSAEDLSFEMAESVNTVAAYNDFQSRFPSNHHAAEAGKSVELLSWKAACNTNTREAYQEFVMAYPQGESLAAVPAHMERIAWDSTCSVNTAEAYETFLRQHPGSEFDTDARRRIEGLDWGRTREVNSVAACDSFLRRYPDGFFKLDAQNHRNALLAEQMNGRLVGRWPNIQGLPPEYAKAKIIEPDSPDILAALNGDVCAAFPDIASQYRTELERSVFLRSPQADSLQRVLMGRKSNLLTEILAMRVKSGLPEYSVERGEFDVDLRELYDGLSTGRNSPEELDAYSEEAKHVMGAFWFENLPLHAGSYYYGLAIEQVLPITVPQVVALALERRRADLEVWVGFRLTGSVHSLRRPCFSFTGWETVKCAEAKQPVLLLIDSQSGKLVWSKTY